MIRHFVSGSLILALAVVGGMSLARSGLKPMRSRQSASVVETKMPRMVDMAKAWRNKKPLQAGMNCFGTTLALFGAAPIPRYASGEEIAEFLGLACRPLKGSDKPNKFDVGVIYDGNSPSDPAHSFLVLTPTLVFYKDGVEAGTAFKAGSAGKMFADFRVGFTKEKCEELIANATSESGLPCPGIVRGYRCREDATFKWGSLDRVEELIYGLTMKRNEPLPPDLIGVGAALRILSAKESLAALQKADAANLRWLRERVKSLDSFFGFYADRRTWGEAEIRGFRATLRDLLAKMPE